MENFFISKIKINHVRHLKNIEIELSKTKRKHLILTGKNGSGKTSVLGALVQYLDAALHSDKIESLQKLLQRAEDELEQLRKQNAADNLIKEQEYGIGMYRHQFQEMSAGLRVEFGQSENTLYKVFNEGVFVLAYYQADRIFQADIPVHIEKVQLQDRYEIGEQPQQMFVKYLLDLKVTEALARNNGNIEKANTIKKWFINFQDLLRDIFEDETLELVFEEDTFRFLIQEKNRELFDFNTLSSGFAAVLDIVLDLIMRMEKVTNKSFDFTIPGIVLIDEIETHLHLELQKTILKFLTSLFPNIQFIVSTHSPFVVNSLENAVIYDLETHMMVKNGLANVPYGGVVEGYFKADEMSNILREKYERYKILTAQKILTDEDFEEIADLEMFLNEIPDYLALNITTEYQRLKMAFENRKDIE